LAGAYLDLEPAMSATGAEIVGHVGQLHGTEVAFRIGLHTLRFRTGDADFRFFVHWTHEPFLVEPCEDHDCDIEWAAGQVRPAPTPVVRRSGERWELRHPKQGIEEFAFRSTEANVPTMLLRMTHDMRQARMVQAPRPGMNGVLFASEYPWSEFITCRLLCRDGGLLVHASSVIFDGGALLFIGHSGAGKSTIAGIAEECGGAVLSDDRTILTVEQDEVRAWGTPWHGTLARTSSASVPVRGMYLLEQARSNSVDLVPTERALKELFVRLIHPRITGVEVGRAIDTLSVVLALTPLRILRFRPTAEAVSLARLEAARAV
jgi:hypothetical protein